MPINSYKLHSGISVNKNSMDVSPWWKRSEVIVPPSLHRVLRSYAERPPISHGLRHCHVCRHVPLRDGDSTRGGSTSEPWSVDIVTGGVFIFPKRPAFIDTGGVATMGI